MATYNVTVYNLSPAEKQFALFCELPQVNPAPAEGKPFANAFAVGRPASNDGQPTTFNVTTKAYACCGYQEISENTIVSSSDNTQVDLNGKNDVATMKILDGGPSFTSPNNSGAADGTFTVKVPSYAQEQYREFRSWTGNSIYFYTGTDNLGIFQRMSGAAMATLRQAETLFVPPVAVQIIPAGSASPPAGQQTQMLLLLSSLLLNIMWLGVHTSPARQSTYQRLEQQSSSTLPIKVANSMPRLHWTARIHGALPPFLHLSQSPETRRRRS
jgi:hypothetical protein